MRRKRFSISLQWISCLIFSYPDLGQQQCLVFPDFVFVSCLQFCSSSLNKNSSCMEVFSEMEWLRLLFENRKITQAHKTHLNHLLDISITKLHSKLFAFLMTKKIFPSKEQIKKYFSRFRFNLSIADDLYKYRSFLNLKRNDFFSFIIVSTSPSEWLEKWLYSKGFNPFKSWQRTSFMSAIEI